MNEVIEYFKEKADEYDLVENQVYWVLSDKLLWHFFKKTVLKKLPEDFLFFDAGGGTGRWSLKILQEFEKASGLIVDLSADMLRQAKQKVEHYKLEDRLALIEGNLEKLAGIASNTYDVSFNFHNVLGFVENPEVVINELVRVTKEGGYVVSLVPNLYHNLFFNLFVNNFNLFDETLSCGKGRFTENMPLMNMFTPIGLKELYERNGLSVELVSGFPITIYPGMQETQIKGSSEHVTDILTSAEIFNKIYETEKVLFQNPDTASRGNQLYIVGKKKEGLKKE